MSDPGELKAAAPAAGGADGMAAGRDPGIPAAPAVALHVFSGVHLGARADLPEGSWVLGSDDSCDLIFSGLEARHAALEISVPPAGRPQVVLSPLDGPVRRGGERFVTQDTAEAPLDLEAGTAWYLGRICLAWNTPGARQRHLMPEPEPAEGAAASAGSDGADGTGGTASAPAAEAVAGRAPAANAVAAPAAGAPGAAASVGALPELPPDPGRKASPVRRMAMLAAAAILLLGLSVGLTPDSPRVEDYPELANRALEEAGLSGLETSVRNGLVIVRGAVEDNAALIRLYGTARNLPFPLRLDVTVRADILRAARASLGMRGLHPDVELSGTPPVLRVASYIRDERLEARVFDALKEEIRGLPDTERRIVHEKEIAPALAEAIQAAGVEAHAVFLPGQVDFAGSFQPGDEEKLRRVRQEVAGRFGVPLAGAIRSPAEAAEQEKSAPLRGAAAARSGRGGDPLGGLRVTGVTMSPMRFVLTEDGRRLFEGARLPNGSILEGIDTRTLRLRRGDEIITHTLRGGSK